MTQSVLLNINKFRAPDMLYVRENVGPYNHSFQAGADDIVLECNTGISILRFIVELIDSGK